MALKIRAFICAALALLIFTAPAAAQTVSAPSLSGGGSFSAPLLGPNGSAAAPTYSFTASPGTGMYSPGVGQLGFSSAGTLKMDYGATNSGAFTFAGSIYGSPDIFATAISGHGFQLQGAGIIYSAMRQNIGLELSSSNPYIEWYPGTIGGSPDLILTRDAAHILDLRDGLNPNGLRVANTFTDLSNGEWGTFNWLDTANVLTIGTKALGTGSSRNMQFVIGGVNKLDFGATNANAWTTGGADIIIGSGGNGLRIPSFFDVNQLQSTGAILAGTKVYGWATSTALATIDTGLSRDSAGVVDVGNGTQGNTSGSINAANFANKSASGEVVLGPQGGTSVRLSNATAVNGALTLKDDARTNSVTLTVGASHLATFDGGITLGSTLLFSTDNTVDIGNSSTFRPRDINAGRNITAGSGTIQGAQLLTNGTGQILWNGRSTMTSPVAGVVQIDTNGGGGQPTVSTLSTCGTSANRGGRSMVTDATVTASGNFGAAVVGGGANVVPVYCDGASWKIGKVVISPANDNLPPAMREQADRLWTAFG